MQEQTFYPMTVLPVPDESDESFSKTVIVYGENFTAVGLGYFDFEMEEWQHSNHNSFLLRCWCYLPKPSIDIDNKWIAIAPGGYKKSLFNTKL